MDDIVKYYNQARDSLKTSLLGDSEQKLAATGEPLAQNFFFKRQQPIEGVNSRQGKQARQASDLFEGGQRSKRSITFQARSSAIDADAQEEPKLTIFSKLFDQTSYHVLDKKQLLELAEKADDYVRMVADELIMGGQLHYVKMMMPSNMWHMVPSQLGLPVIVTHRAPIIASIKIDGAANGQLTSNKQSQLYRQQTTGQQVPNVLGHNFNSAQGLNITAMVHPKIMHSNYRFMFAVEQANQEAYGVQTAKVHQMSLPMEVSVAYSRPKQLVSIAIEPKTPVRAIYTKEAAKTFIGQVSLANSQPDQWLGQEHLVRVPSKQAQYKRLGRQEPYIPALVNSFQSLLKGPKEAELAAIEELETPYKFAHRFVQQLFGLELQLEGATDDEDVVRAMAKSELTKQTLGQLQWTKTEDVDQLDQHSKCGPFADYLHLFDSALNRQSKYLELYTTLKPEQSQQQKSPVYRFNFVLADKSGNQKSMTATTAAAVMDAVVGAQSPLEQQILRQQVESASRRQLGRQEPRAWDQIEQQLLSKKLNQIGQPNMVEAY